VPPPKELRKLVSRWLRNVRRSRVAVGIRDLLNDPSIGKPYLVEFVGRRWAKIIAASARRSEPAIVQSELAEGITR